MQRTLAKSLNSTTGIIISLKVSATNGDYIRVTNGKAEIDAIQALVKRLNRVAYDVG